MNYLEIHTDLPVWLLSLIHDAIILIANLSKRQAIIIGPLTPAEIAGIMR